MPLAHIAVVTLVPDVNKIGVPLGSTTYMIVVLKGPALMVSVAAVDVRSTQTAQANEAVGIAAQGNYHKRNAAVAVGETAAAAAAAAVVVVDAAVVAAVAVAVAVVVVVVVAAEVADAVVDFVVVVRDFVASKHKLVEV